MGPHHMFLSPGAANVMYGRSDFYIHGDNSRGNQSASEGCIILDRTLRKRISKSGDNHLTVTGAH